MTRKIRITALAKSLADEVGKHGILVNNVCPGSILTKRMLLNITARAEEMGVTLEEALAKRAAEIPVGRLGEPRDVAYTIAFLASGKSGLHHAAAHDPEPGWRGGPLRSCNPGVAPCFPAVLPFTGKGRL